MPKNNSKNRSNKDKKKKLSTIALTERYSAVIIILLGILVYFHSIENELVYCDDNQIIEQDSERIASLDKIDDAFSSGYMYTDYYRPIITVSFILDKQFSGSGTSFYHVSNIIVHILFSVMLLLLLRKLGFSSFWALLGVAVYTVHPMFTNAVSWIVGRNDLYYSLFLIISFYFLILYLDTKKLQYFALQALSFLLAVLSKETALVFPLIFMAYILLIRRDKAISQQNIFLVVSWLSADLLWWLMRSAAELGKNVNEFGIDVFLRNLPTLPEFFSKFFLPVHQSVLPTFSTYNTIAGSIMIIVLAAAVLLIKEKKKNYILFGFLWFLILTLPGMFVSLLNASDWNEYLECRAYLPMAGILIVVLDLLRHNISDKQHGKALLTTIILTAVLIAANYIESRNYKTAQAFYESAVEDDDSRALFHEILSNVYYKSGDFIKAEQHLKLMIEANSSYDKFHNKLGEFYFKRGMFPKAIIKFKDALNKDSGTVAYWNNLAMAQFQNKNYTEGLATFERTMSLFPDFETGAYNLVHGYIKIGNIDSAISKYDNFNFGNNNFDNNHFGEENMDKMFALFSNGATYLAEEKKYSEAAKCWAKATEIKPDDKTPYYNLFRLYLYDAPDMELAEKYAAEFLKRGGELSTEELNALSEYRRR